MKYEEQFQTNDRLEKQLVTLKEKMKDLIQIDLEDSGNNLLFHKPHITYLKANHLLYVTQI